MSEKKMVRRSVAVTLGMVCIVLVVVGSIGAVAYVMPMINDKDNAIFSLNLKISQSNTNDTNLQDQISQLQVWLEGNETLLNQMETWFGDNITYYNSQISSLNSQIANLTNQLNSLMDGTEASLGIIVSNPSVWVNRTVTVEGVLGLVFFPAFEYSPWGYVLISGNQTIGVSIGTSVNMSAFWNMFNFSGYARIYGVIEKGEMTYTGNIIAPEVTYYIEALTVEPL
jgi:hypothetical protein